MERLLSRVLDGGSAEQPALATLSDRELEVFELLGRGLTSVQIAARMDVKQKTVETYREKIKRKLGLENSNQFVQHTVRWTVEQQRRTAGQRC